MQVLCCYGHEAEVMRVAWSADGRFIASGDSQVLSWELQPMALCLEHLFTLSGCKSGQ